MSFSLSLSFLEQLPLELRTSIIDYLLPFDTDGARTITIPLLGSDCWIDPEIHVHELRPSCFALRRYVKGIAMTSQLLRSDALSVLYDRTFVFQIDEMTFEACREPECCVDDNPDDPIKENALSILPELDLRRAKLKLLIQPTTNHYLWERLHEFLKVLCQAFYQRIGDFWVRKFTIEVQDTRSLAQLIREEEESLKSMSETAPFAYVVDICLSQFQRYMGKVMKYEIEIPQRIQDDDILQAIRLLQETSCKRHDGSKAGPGTPAPREVWTEEPDMCLPPPEETEEEMYSWGYSRYSLELRKHEYPWLKRYGEEWDDWYCMPVPPFDTDYDLRDWFWVFGDEDKHEEAEWAWWGHLRNPHKGITPEDWMMYALPWFGYPEGYVANAEVLWEPFLW